MKTTPRSRHISTARQDDPPVRRRALLRCRHRILEPHELEQHAWLLAEGKPLSGRHGPFVYYWAYGRQHWRRDVIPRDPRTPAQQRSRAAFATASKGWSETAPLTEERRDAWHAAAAKITSKPRLWQSGILTA
jgi:hypothetical protein